MSAHDPREGAITVADLTRDELEAIASAALRLETAALATLSILRPIKAPSRRDLLRALTAFADARRAAEEDHQPERDPESGYHGPMYLVPMDWR